MGGPGGKELKRSLDDQFFDLTCKVLNYAIEFQRSPGYSSLRFVDVLKGLVELQPEIEGISNVEFYQKVRDKLEARELLAGAESRANFLDDLLNLFVEEWKKIPPKK